MNKLRHLSEFKAALDGYKVSADSQKVLKGTNLVLFAAATSAGRNTIFKELHKTGRYHYVVSDTTRKPRVNDGVLEQNGVEYWFKSEEEMLSNIKSGKMLEAAIIHNQQVSGISMQELEKARDDNKVAITDIEVVGADNIVNAKPDTKCLFVIPPSFEVWHHRLEHRGEMDKQELRRRLESAADEFNTALTKKYYWIVVNDRLSDAVAYIDNIARGLPSSIETQTKNKQALRRLLEDTQEHIATK